MVPQQCLMMVAAMLMALGSNAFTIPSSSRNSPLFMSSTDDDGMLKLTKEKGYVPKWKKKETLADLTGTADLSAGDKGLIGSVPITFQQGKGEAATIIETTALPGQPLKLVASQAGQFIKYGCGKESAALVKVCVMESIYVRALMWSPTDLELDAETGKYPTLLIQVKGTKAKVVSSGKFFSVKSFILGFWNNLLGMMGFVRDRRKAKKNWQERMDKEAEVKRLTEEKKRRRAEEAAMGNTKAQ